MDAMEILVIILSTFLALFLVLAIILTVLLIKVTKQIQMIAETTKQTVDRVHDFAFSATKMLSPTLLVKTILDQFKKYKNKKEN